MDAPSCNAVNIIDFVRAELLDDLQPITNSEADVILLNVFCFVECVSGKESADSFKKYQIFIGKDYKMNKRLSFHGQKISI